MRSSAEAASEGKGASGKSGCACGASGAVSNPCPACKRVLWAATGMAPPSSAPELAVSRPSDPAEREADALAARIVSPTPGPVVPVTPVLVGSIVSEKMEAEVVAMEAKLGPLFQEGRLRPEVMKKYFPEIANPRHGWPDALVTDPRHAVHAGAPTLRPCPRHHDRASPPRRARTLSGLVEDSESAQRGEGAPIEECGGGQPKCVLELVYQVALVVVSAGSGHVRPIGARTSQTDHRP